MGGRRLLAGRCEEMRTNVELEYHAWVNKMSEADENERAMETIHQLTTS